MKKSQTLKHQLRPHPHLWHSEIMFHKADLTQPESEHRSQEITSFFFVTLPT